jgi:hypothetical protein
MPAHPNPEDLVAYAEQPKAFPGKQATEAHLRTCRQCVLHVAALRNLRDLEQEGRLLLPADRAAAPSAVVKEYLKSVAGGGSKLLTGLGIFTGAIAAGIAGLSGVTGAEPALAGRQDAAEQGHPDEDSPGPVRSGDTEASVPVESEHMATPHHIEQANPIIGTPERDAHLFPGKQGYADTCAIRCQEYIIRQYTGLDLPEKFYVDEAKAHGWYHPGAGTYAPDIGNLLEYHNIPVHRYQEANIFNLTGELAQGHKVIVGVHADDLWSDNWVWRDIRQALGFSAADHAVVVTGIDTHDPENVQVIVSDPGKGDVAARYPIEKFLPAWREGHFYMVSTQEPPPAHMHLPEMENFDYRAGHIHHIGDMSYDDFQHMAHEHEAHAHDPAWTTGHQQSDGLVERIGHGEHSEPVSGVPHHDPDLPAHRSADLEHPLHPHDSYEHRSDAGHEHHTPHSADHGPDFHHHDTDHDFDGHDDG